MKSQSLPRRHRHHCLRRLHHVVQQLQLELFCPGEVIMAARATLHEQEEQIMKSMALTTHGCSSSSSSSTPYNLRIHSSLPLRLLITTTTSFAIHLHYQYINNYSNSLINISTLPPSRGMLQIISVQDIQDVRPIDQDGDMIPSLILLPLGEAIR